MRAQPHTCGLHTSWAGGWDEDVEEDAWSVPGGVVVRRLPDAPSSGRVMLPASEPSGSSSSSTRIRLDGCQCASSSLSFGEKRASGWTNPSIANVGDHHGIGLVVDDQYFAGATSVFSAVPGALRPIELHTCFSRTAAQLTPARSSWTS